MQPEPDSVFREEQFRNSAPDGMDAHYWHQARNRIVLRRLRRLRGAREGLVLDIGCGRGIVVQSLRRKGLQVIGAELGTPEPISPDVAPHLHLGAEAFELPAALRAEVRVALLLDLLEHLDDPAGFLGGCVERFPGMQHALVTLPARQELYSNYDAYYGHKLRFDEGSLAELSAGAGLALEAHGYFFHALYAPARLMSALGMDRQVTVHAPRGPARWAHWAVGACLAAEDRLVPSGVPGTSLWAVLRVPGRA